MFARLGAQLDMNVLLITVLDLTPPLPCANALGPETPLGPGQGKPALQASPSTYSSSPNQLFSEGLHQRSTEP